MVTIGSYTLTGQALLAPMAGISDAPFRKLCFDQGAALCVSEMLASKAALWHSKKSQERTPLCHNSGLRVVQLVGTEAQQLAQAARYYVAQGAQIIDINMGCPAKKVCRKAAGSALLREPKLVAAICHSVVAAVPVPVTLKIRTGWCPQTRNTLEIARIAQESGIQSLVIHGRTRACRFVGSVEYDNIAAAKQLLRIPVIANGDIDSGAKAKEILDYTRADGVMIGRAAQGNPWIFSEINAHLTQQSYVPPSANEILTLLRQHVQACTQYYGELMGPRIARKHASVYFERWFLAAKRLRSIFNRFEHCQQQLNFLDFLSAQLSTTPTHAQLIDIDLTDFQMPICGTPEITRTIIGANAKNNIEGQAA